MPSALARIIQEEIQQRGPMPFSRWMELCLYHPVHGYYMKPGRKTGAGRDADFATPPTLHPFFGEAIGRELSACWEMDGRPDVWRVVEYGGGEGDLARNALRGIDATAPELGRAIEWHQAEVSPHHRELMAGISDSRIRIVAADRGFGYGMPAGGTTYDLALACEFLDALPFEVERVRVLNDEGHVAHERLHVVWREESFQEAWLPTTTTGIEEVGPPHVRALQINDWACDVWHMPPRVRHMLVVDYGAKRPATEVRGYRRQGHADVLDDPGNVDITASVDFRETRIGIELLSGSEDVAPRETYETLEEFLLRHGILEALNATDRSTPEGASAYLRLRQLLLPTGLGALFKVQRFDRTAPGAP